MENIKLDEVNSSEYLEYLTQNVKLKLYKTAMSILKNDDDACDAIQETLLSSYKNFENLNNKQFFSTWITRILINKCYDIIKKNKKVVEINEKVKVEERGFYESYASESILENVLNKIDTDLRTVTVLFYYDELSVSEIAEILNIPEGTVKSRLSRARKVIYEILMQEEGEV